MKIAVLGTGVVGRAIAEKLNEIGHDVAIGTRNVERTLNGANDEAANSAFIEWHNAHDGVGVQQFKEASVNADVVFNCTGGKVTLDVLNSIGAESLGQKILIDVANPLDFSQGMPPTLNPTNTDSLAENIQRNFPNLKVVKSLNTMTAGLMMNPGKLNGEHNVFVSGNDESAKEEVKSLLQEVGWPANSIIDLGDITSARGAEMILPIWLRIWQKLGTAEFNFHIQKN